MRRIVGRTSAGKRSRRNRTASLAALLFVALISSSQRCGMRGSARRESSGSSAKHRAPASQVSTQTVQERHGRLKVKKG